MCDAIKKGTRYRYYVSRPLITNKQTESSAGLRIAAVEIEQLVTSRVRQWLLDPPPPAGSPVRNLTSAAKALERGQFTSPLRLSAARLSRRDWTRHVEHLALRRDHADRTYTRGHLEKPGPLGLPCCRTKGIWP
jgi:hypothetical protein